MLQKAVPLLEAMSVMWSGTSRDLDRTNYNVGDIRWYQTLHVRSLERASCFTQPKHPCA